MRTGADRYFQSGDTRLRYRDEGEGPVVLLLHGWTFDLDVWEPQVAALARERRVIRLDRRGFGQSGGTPDAAADVDDLEALLAGLGIAESAIVGMSQGARAAIGFALRHPARVVALVLDGPPGGIAGVVGEDDEDLSFAEFRRLARAAGLGAFSDAWRRHPLMRLRTGEVAMHALVARVIERYPGRDLTGPDPAPAPAIGPDALARLAMPVLVVNGEFDTPQRLQAGSRLAKLLPRGERAVVAGAGHLANLDDPRAYGDVVRTFLGRQSRAAA